MGGQVSERGRAGRRSRTDVVPTPQRLAELLARAAGGSANRTEVALTVAATGVLLLGAPVRLVPAFWQALADSDDPLPMLRGVWSGAVAAHPFLDGHLGVLLHWATGPQVSPDDVDGLRRSAAVMAGLDLRAAVSQPLVDGELLGPLYTLLRGRFGQVSLGAFFTPMGVSRMMADALGVGDRSEFVEPCCGAGAMAIAAARSMRAAGRDPATVRWVLNDLDPMAVALTGVNAAAHGLGPRVTLSCGDGLQLGTGLPGDGLRSRDRTRGN